MRTRSGSFFSPYGTILRASIAKDSEGRNRGFAHVDFESVEQAQAAMQALNNGTTSIGGRYVNLDYAAKATKAPAPPSKTLYFLRYPGDEGDLRAALSEHEGSVVAVRLLNNQNGFIEFKNIDDATAAKEALDRTQTPDGHTLNLLFSTPRPTRNTNDRGS
ncbi:hypothetical protein BT96DRAFT_691822, partial [Gymnopus androsaceus JB14]